MSEHLVLVTSRGLCQVAALAWFVYDYFLCLEDEVEHVWHRKFSITSFLYFWARILSFVMLMIGAVQATRTYDLSPAQCDIFHWVEGGGTILIFVNTQLVLQYRLWLLYGRNMKILLLNGVLFVVEAASAIVVCSMYYSHQSRADIDLPVTGLTGETCTTVAQREMALVFICVLVYELWLAGMALFRTIQGRKGRLVNVTGQRTLTEVIAYDSVMYFAMIVLSAFVGILVWLFAPLYPGNAIVCFTRAASGIGASRLILHMRTEFKVRDEASYSRPECIGVDLRFDTSAIDSPCHFVRARPSLSTHGSSLPSVSSPRPSLMTLFSSSRRGSDSTVASEARRGSASSSGHSPGSSLAAMSVSTHESPLFYGGSPRPSVASIPYGHLPRPSTSSAASSFYTPRPSVVSLAASTSSGSGSSTHSPRPSLTVLPAPSSQRSPPRDFFLELPPV